MRYLTLLIALTCAAPTLAVTTQDLNSTTPTQLVTTLLGMDAAVTVSNITVTGDNRALGIFSGGFADGLAIDNGVILSNGDISNAVGPNLSDGKSTEFNTAGDADLETLARGAELRDAAVLTFDFVPTQSGQLQFRYVFASEEYNEFVGAQFNDVFGFFLGGQNIATLGGSAVAINSVNKNRNSTVFNNNSVQDFTPPTPFATEFDGFTEALTATALVEQGLTYRIKLVIADSNDSSFDSAVFLEQGAFRVNALPIARFTNQPVTDNPLAVQLDGSGSSDSDGSIVNYAWETGDGQTATGTQASFTFPENGIYPVTLTVTDNEGATGSLTRQVTVGRAVVNPNPPADVPTLSEWAMIVLSLLLVLMAGYWLRRQGHFS